MKKKRLGEVLTERGKISAADLTRGLQQQKEKSGHLGELLLQLGLISKEDLVATLTEMSGVPYFDSRAAQPDADTLRLVTAQLARKYCALPIELNGKSIVVVLSEPQNFRAIEELRFKTGLKIEPRIGLQGEILAAIDRLYGSVESAGHHAAAAAEDLGMEFISSTAQERNVQAMREMQAELQQQSQTTPAVQLVASIIRDAAAKQSSDIHIEPQPDEAHVRFRVDGMLRDYGRIPRALQNTVVSRIKILSDMDIAERRVPQDGRFLVRIGPQRIDFRVSTLPTQYGEKVVLRLLESDAPLKDFASLGIAADIVAELQRILRLPQGMLLVTGPTGSGKSTTLYASLAFIKQKSLNIVTVENPVEYVLPGLNQVQINPKAGLTFAGCLRSVLRQDPDVVMIGEIRDKETAEIALKAAQTGHLVLSTLHTNDSISSVTRLLDLGVPAYEISSALTAVIAQRLVRRLCACHHSSLPESDYVRSLLSFGLSEAPKVRNLPNGCKACDFTGYRGRVGVYELLCFTEAVQKAARSEHHEDAIRAEARHAGMKLLQQHAMAAVREGLTTLEEVERVVTLSAGRLAESCESCRRDLSPQFLFCPFCGERRRFGGEAPLGKTEFYEEACRSK
jgi:type IV pilus assembly protein PilB